MTTYKILILGASYGSLLATKLLLAGHTVKMVCLPAEADLFNTEGAIVRMPVKGREGLVEIHRLLIFRPADVAARHFNAIYQHHPPILMPK
jgi:ketopantoate reductase